MNFNIILGLLNAVMLSLNLFAGGQGPLYTSALVITAFATGWCFAFGLATIINRRYGT